MQTDTQAGAAADQAVPAATQANELPPLSPSITATAPGQLKIIKRNGTVVPYTADKINVALTKAFLAVEGGTAAASPRIRELCITLADQVTNIFKRRLPSGGTLHIEDVQDQVELALMRAGEHKIARDYVIYREERARERAAKAALSPETEATASTINVVQPDGTRAPLDIARIQTIVGEVAKSLCE